MSTITSALNQENKRLVWRFWNDLRYGSSEEVPSIAASALGESFVWHAQAPLGSGSGSESFVTQFLGPLKRSFPDMDRETFIFFGGRSNGRVDGAIQRDGRMWVTGTGRLHATFANDYLGVPASGSPVSIPWGEFCRIENGKIVETFFLLDMIELARQAGIDLLPPSKGATGTYPPPSQYGIVMDTVDPGATAQSLAHIRRFIFEGLNAYDEASLGSMGMAAFFHRDVRWYGPGGIGACFNLAEFESLHQTPWLAAFPDRKVRDLDALIAEGNFSGAPGWGGVEATHAGSYLGHRATGTVLQVNGLDWWLRLGDQYVENWVFVDMIHLFSQMGVDLLSGVADGHFP